MAFRFVAYKSKHFPGGVVGLADAQGKTLKALASPQGAPITSVYDLIEHWDSCASHLVPVPRAPEEQIDEVEVQAPLTGRDVLAVGKNYREHAREFQQSGFDSSDKNEQPDSPVIFTKRASSIVPNGTPVYPHPSVTSSLDYEGELGIIIGQGGIGIKKDEAWNHVWGAVIINDMTARERQRDHKQFFIGKSLDTFCPMGTYAVHASSLDWNNMILETKVNGQVRQSQNTKDLIFDIPTLIETVSMGITLMPGDVIATGTPAGVGIGKQPPIYLKPGDRVEVSITGLGTLTNEIASADSPPPPCLPVRVSTSKSSYSNPDANSMILPSAQRLHVEDNKAESKPAAVFIHGLGGASTSFQGIISAAGLQETHRVILIDWEGHGLSPLTGAALSLPALARSVCVVLDNLQVEKATLVAHSMGGLIATHFAAAYPHRVTKMVLFGPVKQLGPPGVAAMTDRAALVRKDGMTAVVPAIIQNGLSDQTRQSNGLAQAFVKASLLATNPEAYAEACLALGSAQDPQYSQIQAPVLIVAADQDKTSPSATVNFLKEAISNVKIVPLTGVGHWHMVEDVSGSARALQEFLA